MRRDNPAKGQVSRRKYHGRPRTPFRAAAVSGVTALPVDARRPQKNIASLNAEHGGKWQFAIPEAGGVLWTDNFVVPIGSRRAKNVERLIDYYYDPEVAAQVAAAVNFIVPVVGAQEAMLEIDPQLAEDPLIFPDAETLAQVKVFRTLSGAEEQSFSSAFQSVLLSA